MAEGPGKLFQPVDARLFLPVFERYLAVYLGEFFRGHAGISDKNQASLRVAPYQRLHRLRLALPLRVAPDPVPDGIVEIVDAQIPELSLGIVEQSLDRVDVR